MLFPESAAPINISNPILTRRSRISREKVVQGRRPPPVARELRREGSGRKVPHQGGSNVGSARRSGCLRPPAGPQQPRRARAASAPSSAETAPKRPADSGSRFANCKRRMARRRDRPVHQVGRRGARQGRQGKLRVLPGCGASPTQEINNHHDGGVEHANGRLWRTYYKELSEWQCVPPPKSSTATPGSCRFSASCRPPRSQHPRSDRRPE